MTATLWDARGAVGFIADQNAGTKGLFVDFFGRAASTYKSIGLVAIYFSVQVNQRLQVGDMAGATKNSGLAKTWGIILLALGIIGLISLISS